MRKLSRDHVALGEAIRHQRRELGLSQTGLAGRCGLHRTYVASVERGERNLGYANLLKIAAGLELGAAQLVRRAAGPRADRRPSRSAPGG